jgi:hypothetical protein
METKKKISHRQPLDHRTHSDSDGRTGLALSGQNPHLLLGKKVRVNCYNGVIKKVITHIYINDSATGNPFNLPLRNPLFVVKIDRRTKKNWGTGRIVFIPATKPQVTLKLFSDEFEILNNHV